MAKMTFKGESVETLGDFPKEGSQGAPFTLVNRDLQEISLEALGPKKKILNIFVSLDTSVCAVSIEKFAQALGQREDVVLLNISMDLPFAASRFCQAHQLQNVQTLSAFRSSFPKDYGVLMISGPLKGLCSRAVIILDESNRVIYTEHVPEVTQEPSYTNAFKVLSHSG